MRIKFKPFRRKDGTIMLYVNNDRGVSIGISEDYGLPYSYSRGMTNGKRNLLSAVFKCLQSAEGIELSGVPNFDLHEEDKAKLDIGDFYMTDIAIIGGVHTGADGAYLVTKGGKVLYLDQWFVVDDGGGV